jgi:hypothetical protein
MLIGADLFENILASVAMRGPVWTCLIGADMLIGAGMFDLWAILGTRS